jgi:hypothetical protein
VAEASDQDGLAGFLDLFADSERSSFEFRDGDFFYGSAPKEENHGTLIDHRLTMVGTSFNHIIFF